MSSTGQFRIARDIFYDWTAEDRPWCSLALWLYIIGRGQYQDTTVTFLGHQFPLSRGQLVTTASHLCDISGWTPKRLRTFLAKCQKDGKIVVTGTPNGTVISVINYDKWQGQTKGQSKGQASEQLQTDNGDHGGQTKGQSKGQQSIEGVKYLRCSVSKESLEDMSCKPSKVTKKHPKVVMPVYSISWDDDIQNFAGISDVAITDWKSRYPLVDVLAETQKAREWLMDTGNRKDNYALFLAGWFRRTQDKLALRVDASAVMVGGKVVHLSFPDKPGVRVDTETRKPNPAIADLMTKIRG